MPASRDSMEGTDLIAPESFEYRVPIVEGIDPQDTSRRRTDRINERLPEDAWDHRRQVAVFGRGKMLVKPPSRRKETGQPIPNLRVYHDFMIFDRPSAVKWP
jgi:hypothetical protein